MRRAVPAALLLLSFACAHSRESFKLGPAGELEVKDTLPRFLQSLRSHATPVPEGPLAAWGEYERVQAELLQAAGALGHDPGDQQLRKLSVSPTAVLQLVEAFDASAGADLGGLAQELERQLGGVPAMVVALAVARGPAPVFRGMWAGRPLLLINARHPDFIVPEARLATLARELFTALHRTREPDSASLSPLAQRVFREGAGSLATRQLVPRALEHQILAMEESRLARLRGHEPLIAKELLAALDSGSEAEVARFFDGAVKDPLLPAGAGPFVSDRLYQCLTRELGSTQKALQVDGAAFLSKARRHLAEMAAGR